MARTRLLKPGFFTNDSLAECDPLARILFAGLWTLADRAGRLEYRPARIKAQVLPYDAADVPGLVGQLEARGFVRRYEVDGAAYLQVEAFTRHQNPHRNEGESVCPEPPKTSGENETRVIDASTRVTDASPRVISASTRALTLNPLTLTLNPSSESPSPAAKRPRSEKPAEGITWTAAGGWAGITEADRAAWRQAYPAVALDAELARASEWLRANPTKAHRSAWRRFVTSWLSRTQDRGGTRGQPAEAPKPPRWIDQVRPAPYRTPREAEQLAATLSQKMKES